MLEWTQLERLQAGVWALSLRVDDEPPTPKPEHVERAEAHEATRSYRALRARAAGVTELRSRAAELRALVEGSPGNIRRRADVIACTMEAAADFMTAPSPVVPRLLEVLHDVEHSLSVGLRMADDAIDKGYEPPDRDLDHERELLALVQHALADLSPRVVPVDRHTGELVSGHPDNLPGCMCDAAARDNGHEERCPYAVPRI